MAVGVQPASEPAEQHILCSNEAARRECDEEVVDGIQGDTIRVGAERPAQCETDGICWRHAQL